MELSQIKISEAEMKRRLLKLYNEAMDATEDPKIFNDPTYRRDLNNAFDIIQCCIGEDDTEYSLFE